MADFRINVIVDPAGSRRGGRRVRGELTRIDRAARRTGRLIAAAFAFAGLTAGLGQVVELADTFQALENQVRVAVGPLGEVEETLDALFDVADRTRAPIESVVQLFQRGSIAADELGASNAELLSFVEAVGAGLATQGGSAAAASGALTQLSQVLGSGIVRAEEFNSVLEGAFPIALAAAQGIDRAGGSVAQLRQLIVAGEITSREFFEAILSQADELNATLATTNVTLSQATTNLRNALIQVAQEVDLGPLVGAIEDVTELIRDPDFQRGFAVFVAGLTEIASLPLEVFRAVGDLGDRIAAGAAALTGNLSEVDALEREIADIDDQLTALESRNPLRFVDPLRSAESIRALFLDPDELRAQREALLAQRDAILAAQGVLEREVAVPDVEPPDRAPPPEAVTDEQREFIAGLRQQAEELRLQATLGEEAEAALARYRTELQIIATEAGPQVAAEARSITESIIAQNRAIADSASLDAQRAFIEGLEQQEQALAVQVEAGQDAADALFLYETAITAATIGGEDFVALSTDIAQGVLEQQRALARLQETQARAEADVGVVEALEDQLRLLRLTREERAVAVALSRLSADATDEQRAAVAELAGEVFRLQEAEREQLAIFDQFTRDLASAARSTLAGALSDPLTEGLEEIPARFAAVLQDLASEALASEIFRLLAGLGGPESSGLLGAIGNFFGRGAGLPRFQQGGEFVIPGSGPPDSRIVAFRGSPGETITATPPGRERGTTVVQAPPAQVQVVNVQDPAEIPQAMDSEAGAQVILNTIRRNPDAVREVL